MGSDTTIKHYRGVESNLNGGLSIGELAYTTDSKKLFVGNGIGSTIVSGLIQGTIANRPTAGYPNRMYFATDTNRMYVDTGAAWVELAYQRPLDFLIETAPTGIVDKSESEISFVLGTRTFAISPVGASFGYYYQGTRYTVTSSKSVQIPDTQSTYYMYFDADMEVKYATSFPQTQCLLAIVRYEPSTPLAMTWDERHGVVMDKATHRYLHFIFGAQWLRGLDISGYVLDSAVDADCQIGISDGVVADEDLEYNITDSATPSAPYEQILTKPAQIQVHYLSGSNVITEDSATDYPVKNTDSGLINWNEYSGGTWSQTEGGNQKFIAYWIVATSELYQPIISVQGQREDGTLAAAQANNLWYNMILAEYPVNEWKPLYRLIFQTYTNAGNTIKGEIVDVLDVRRKVGRDY